MTKSLYHEKDSLKPTKEHLELNRFNYLILGGGYFGFQAAEKLLNKLGQKSQRRVNPGQKRSRSITHQVYSGDTESPNQIWIVDRRPDCLSFSRLRGGKVGGLHLIIAEAVDFLDAFLTRVIGNADDIMIVPAVPFHLAAEWLIKSLSRENSLRIKRFPMESSWNLPFEYPDPFGNRYLSMATWQCPENCLPAPHSCSLTGMERPMNLFDLIKERALETGEFQEVNIKVIISRQLAPGLGAYPCHELTSLRDLVIQQSGSEKLLVATACTCHGVITALRIGRIQI